MCHLMAQMIESRNIFALNLPYPVNCYIFSFKYQTCAEIIMHGEFNFIEIHFPCDTI